MPVEIEIPGKGIAEFPDGMSKTDMETAIFERFPDLADSSPRARNKADLLAQRKAALRAETPGMIPLVRGAVRDMLTPGEATDPVPIPETESFQARAEPPGTDLQGKVPLTQFDVATPQQAEMERQSSIARNRFEQEWPETLALLKTPEPGIMQAASTPIGGAMPHMAPAEEGAGTAEKVGRGTVNAIATLTDFFRTPLFLGTLGLGGAPVGVQRAASAMFAADMVSGVPGIARELGEALERGDTQKATEMALTGLGTAYFTAKTGGAALKTNRELLAERLAGMIGRAELVEAPRLVSEFTPAERVVLPKSVAAAEQIKPTTEVPSAILKTSEEISRDVRQPEVAPESARQMSVEESRAATPEAPITAKPERGLPETATESDLMSDMSEAARKAWNEAKQKKDEFQGVDITHLSESDRRNLARLGLSQTVDRRNRIVGTYPQRLRAEDLKRKVQESRAPIVEAPIEESVFRPEALQTPASETVGIKPGPGMIVSPEATGRFLRKYFTKEEGFPEEVHALRGEMAGAKTRIDRDIAYASRSLMDSLGEVYGMGRLEKLGGGSRKIPPQAVQLMDEYVKGRVANPNAIPAEIRGPLDNFRAQIDSWSTEVIDTLQRQLNRLPPQSAEAQALANRIETVRNNLGIYAHRSYKFFDSSSPAPDWYQKLPAGDRLAAEDYLMQNAPQAMTREQAQSKLLDWLSDLKPTGEPTGRAAKVGAMDLTQFLRRKVIPEELRAVLGEYRNPLVNYAKSVSNMADFVAKQKFLEETKRVGMGRFLFEEGQNPPGFNARIASEGTDSMSPLSGLRTSQEIADAFAQLDRVPVKNNLWRTYLLLNAQTKIAATVQSVLTQSRNLLSRPMMAMFAGHFDPRPIPNAVKTMFADVIDKPGAREAYLQRAAELQLTGGHASSGEVIALLKDAALQDVAPAELHQWSLLRAVKKVGWDIPAKVYRASDDLGNLVAWENEIASQRKINPQKTRSELEVDAAEIVREIYPTYSETPRVVKAMRHIPFGPFVTFSYQIVRSAVNASRRATRELQSPNPAERIVGAKRAAGIAGALTLGFGLQEMSKAMLGISTQEEDDFRSFQPDWAKNSKWAFTGKDPTTGQLSAVNLSYIDPYSYLSDPVMGLISGIRSDQDALEVTARLMSESLRPWASEQMLAGAVADSMRNTTKTGSKIYQETDSFDEKSLKIARHIGKTLLPGTVQRLNRRIIPAFKGEQPSYGRKLEPGPEIARELTGVAIEQFDFRNGLAYKAGEFLQRERDAEEGFRRSASTYKTISPEQLLSDYTEMDTRRFEIWKQMRGHFLAAVRRGVSVKEAKELLTAKGVSKDDARFIERGIYKPFEPSAELQKKARDAKHPLPMAEIRDVLRARNRQRLDPEK